MILELLASAVINPNLEKLELIPYGQNTVQQNQEKIIEQRKVIPPYEKTFFIPEKINKDFKSISNEYKTVSSKVIKDFNLRKSDTKQFLKWVNLPEEQLKIHGRKSHLDEIYAQADYFRMKTKYPRPLVVLGIGGSKHTAEFLLNMNGLGNKGRVYFYSDIDPVSFFNFIKEIDTPINEINFFFFFLSGTTFETKDSFDRFERMLYEYYRNNGFNDKDARKAAQSHFAICTDKHATSKNLRGKIGSKNGIGNAYTKELYIHDGVGGRFSMFDDAGIFVSAYAGVPKSRMVRILKSAKAITNFCLSDDIEKNPAMMSAIFNNFSDKNGYTLTQQQYFGRIFENGGENWIKQLYLESLKSFEFNASKAPDSMHYAAESLFYPDNTNKYKVVMTVMPPFISQNYNKYVSAILESYAERVPVEFEVLLTEADTISPEAIGSYVQCKHFEVLYTGMLNRVVKNMTQPEKLPEVLQPNVEVYKNKFKPNSKYELKPGM